MTVSRGLYQYLCNGEASGIEETWECHEQGDERCIESVRYARPVGIVIRVDSTERGGRFSHCRIHMRRELSTGPMEISADYCFEDSGLRVHVLPYPLESRPHADLRKIADAHWEKLLETLEAAA